MLGGPKESLFERSLGVGREEWPPIAVVVQVQEQVLPSINLLFLFIYLCMIECHVCSGRCKDLDGLVMKLFLDYLVTEYLMKNKKPTCVFPHLEGPDHTPAQG